MAAVAVVAAGVLVAVYHFVAFLVFFMVAPANHLPAKN